METKTFVTRGTCSRSITYDIDDERRVHNVRFQGGCPGNAIGIARLVEGMKADEVARLLRGECKHPMSSLLYQEKKKEQSCEFEKSDNCLHLSLESY